MPRISKEISVTTFVEKHTSLYEVGAGNWTLRIGQDPENGAFFDLGTEKKLSAKDATSLLRHLMDLFASEQVEDVMQAIIVYYQLQDKAA